MTISLIILYLILTIHGISAIEKKKHPLNDRVFITKLSTL